MTYKGFSLVEHNRIYCNIIKQNGQVCGQDVTDWTVMEIMNHLFEHTSELLRGFLFEAFSQR